MPPKKLSESDKQEILDRYCHSDETTVTLASQYGVSTSTISRILKQSLPEDEYEALVQHKRYGTRLQPEQEMLPGLDVDPAIDLDSDEFEDEDDFESAPQRRYRKRSSAGTISAEQLAASLAQLSQLELAPSMKRVDDLELQLESPETLEPIKPNRPIKKAALVIPEALVELEDELEDDEDLQDESDLDDEEDDLEDDEDLDEEDDLEDDFEESEGSLGDSIPFEPIEKLQILPLADAPIPRTCYVVVDRSSELITRPLKDFANLGQVSTEEVQERTLPIFDNHRVAKRFLRRMQRIVKVPDGRIFQKVQPYLQAKGITHLLIDGQVYSLNEG
ncbi:MAG: hypothetical protein MUF72_21565 [Elainella sp. Prado103]|jgi:hypothetical protein|nr:hypothetical protein [Elainella sp. Prado103]